MQADTISSRGPGNHSSIRHRAIATIVAVVAMLASGGDDRGAAFAQASPPAGVVANGNAVVTGFSGAQPPAMIAPGVDPAGHHAARQARRRGVYPATATAADRGATAEAVRPAEALCAEADRSTAESGRAGLPPRVGPVMSVL
jgi:hypothetical protein